MWNHNSHLYQATLLELRISVVVKIGPGSRIMLSPASSEGDGQDEMTRLRHALQHVRHSPRKVILIEFDVSRSGFPSCSYFVWPAQFYVGVNPWSAEDVA